MSLEWKQPSLENYIPKDSTQQESFLSKYQKYDGREIKIAILDSGIDLSLEGLQTTSEGLPKIIDCFDFTGAGNVDTSVIREMDSENILIGLSGQKFKIPTKWINPSGKWHLGIKALPKPTRIEEEKNSRTSEGKEKDIEKLQEIDCIVWNDGQTWLACIETLKDEDLEGAKVLTNFRDEQKYGIFSTNEFKNLCYCITVHNDGNLLEIYMPYSDHGNSVAQVAAANFSSQPELNGLAPGAQIVSICIANPHYQGDPHHCLGMTVLKKALQKCMEIGVDIINYSTGFPPKTNQNSSDYEIVEKTINKMAKEKNILFFKSAGNRGPFYSTTSKIEINFANAIFTIGAILTPTMKKKIYNARYVDYACEPHAFYFSSRGPGSNGQICVDFVAPGAAITDIARFNSVKNSECCGTSYSSPNAAGSIACLLSALKQNSIQFSPFMIKFALIKTAHLPKNRNKLEFGHGIIQIDAAFDYCKQKMDKALAELWSKMATINNIYFIHENDDEMIQEFKINLNHLTCDITNENSPKIKWILKVSAPNAKKFIQISEIKDSKNSFSVKIDINELERGVLTFEEIQIFHPFSLGPLYNIPVTVIVPIKIDQNHSPKFEKEITLNYENPYYIFIDPSSEIPKICKIRITSLVSYGKQIVIQYAIHKDKDKITDEKNEKVLNFFDEFQSNLYTFPIQTKGIYQISIDQMMLCPAKAPFKLVFNFEDGEEKENMPM